jgi:hypothetical protein
MNITLNLSGQIFQVPPTTLYKIPYFKNMLETCDSPSGNQNGDNTQTIFVERSSHIFKHVLAFTIDPLYPYPKKYAFELDFYDITYNKHKLYDKHQVLMDNISTIENRLDNLAFNFGTLQNEVDTIREQVDNIANKYGKVSNNISTMKHIIDARICKNCEEMCEYKSLYCRDHKRCRRDYEDHEGCSNDPDKDCNYCEDHKWDNLYCDFGGCDNYSDGGLYCNEHKDQEIY